MKELSIRAVKNKKIKIIDYVGTDVNLFTQQKCIEVRVYVDWQKKVM